MMERDDSMEMNYEIVFQKHNEVAIEESRIPDPKQDEVLIRTECSLISTGTELSILEGKDVPAGSIWDNYGKMPFKPGYNNIGTVVEVGSGVSKDWIGKKLANYERHAAYVTTNINEAMPVPPNIKDEHAVFFTLAEIALNGIRRGDIELGQTAVVYGMGLIGQLAVRFCKMCGAKTVIAVDISDYRLEMLPRDAHIVSVNSSKDDLMAVVREVTRGRMADVAFEITGNAALIPDEFKVLRRQGRFVVLSSPKGKTLFDFHDLCNGPSYTIIGAHNNSHPKFETPDNPWTNKRDCELFFDMILDGDIDMEPLISHKVNYREAANIYSALLKDRSKALGVILEWN